MTNNLHKTVVTTIFLPSLTIASTFSAGKTEVIWDSFTRGSNQNKTLSTKESLYPAKRNLSVPFNKITNKDYDKKSLVVWEKVPIEESYRREEIKWIALSTSESKSQDLIVSELRSQKGQRIPSSYQQAEILYGQIKPKDKDFLPPLELGPALPNATLIAEGFSNIKVFTLSAFTGGAAGGSGNQNYAVKYDYGFSKNIQLSAFYSVADDPLYSQIKVHNSKNTPNYWESYGASVKVPLYKKKPLDIALQGSIESWNVRSGGPNIFNNGSNIVSTQNLVGSIIMPVDWKLKDNINISMISGISFLPEAQGEGQGGKGKFYGNNIFLGTGISWKPIANLRILGSALIPYGPGENSFNSELKYSREPILNAGINWNINPRIGIEGLITNGFGATPATGVLTIPSANKIGYYAGIKYTQLALDSPQKILGQRQESIAQGGITVNTGLVPTDGSKQLWGNIDNEGNMFGYLGYSLSNAFQLDVANIGSFQNVPKNEGVKKELAKEYTNDDRTAGRVGGKFVLASPKPNFPFWTSARVSVGRSKGFSRGSGYLFTELINTWEANRWLAIHFNPKVAWSGIASPKGIGIGANIQLAERFQLIPEYNIVDRKSGNSNASIGLRWLYNESMHFDIYLSSAAGLHDIGQLISSEEPRLGARFNINY